jgi:thiamine kinase-like enzyme
MTNTIGIPQRAEEITSQWLTAALRRSKTIENAVVTSFRMKPIGVEQGFVGSLFRFKLDYLGDEDPIPKSLVAKFSPVDPDDRNTHKETNLRETSFYQTLAPDRSLPVAKCYYADFDPVTGASILLLQDLSGMRTVDFLEGCTLQDADLAVRALAHIHAAWWNHPELENMPWLSSLADWPYQEWWDQYPRAIRALLPNLDIPDVFLEAGQRFSSNMEEIVDRLEGSPMTLIHRDIHVDNLLFGELSFHPPVAIVDWQAAGRGIGISDAAYFLISSLPTQLRRQHEYELVRTYHRLLVASGVQDYDFDRCWSDYKFSAAAKLFITVAATIIVDNTSDHRQAWRRADLQRLAAFIEDHNINEIL